MRFQRWALGREGNKLFNVFVLHHGGKIVERTCKCELCICSLDRECSLLRPQDSVSARFRADRRLFDALGRLKEQPRKSFLCGRRFRSLICPKTRRPFFVAKFVETKNKKCERRFYGASLIRALLASAAYFSSKKIACVLYSHSTHHAPSHTLSI